MISKEHQLQPNILETCKVTLDHLSEALWPDQTSIRQVEYFMAFLLHRKKFRNQNEHNAKTKTDDRETDDVDQDPNPEDLIEEGELKEPAQQVECKFYEDPNTWHPNINPNEQTVTIEDIHKQRLLRLKQRDELVQKMSQEEYLYYGSCVKVSFSSDKRKFLYWLKKHCHFDSFGLELNRALIEVLSHLVYANLEKVAQLALKKMRHGQIGIKPKNIELVLKEIRTKV